MLLSFIVTVLVFLTVSYVSASKLTAKWDHFTFTQEWPQTACIMGKKEGKHCKIPSYITSFVIHGLWPSAGWSSKGPTDCLNSTFNMNAIKYRTLDTETTTYYCRYSKSLPVYQYQLIKNLTDLLNSRWPNLYDNTPPKQFWEHEWDTHGTCALSLPATGTEYLFFKKTLDLMGKYNISTYLNQAKIFPDDNKNYFVPETLDTLKKQLGVTVDLECTRGYLGIESSKSILAEIRICMDKKFKLIDCKSKKDKTLYFKSRKSYTLPCKGKFIFPKIKR